MVLWRFHPTGGDDGLLPKEDEEQEGACPQVYESHWDPGRGHTTDRSVRAVGYEHELRESGIADPIAHLRSEVDSTGAGPRGRGGGSARYRTPPPRGTSATSPSRP